VSREQLKTAPEYAKLTHFAQCLVDRSTKVPKVFVVDTNRALSNTIRFQTFLTDPKPDGSWANLQELCCPFDGD